MRRLKDYERIAGKESIERIRTEAEKLNDKHIVCISSTYQMGGVAEILNSIVPLFNLAGLNYGWRILHGSPDFFTITKKFHNALQGDEINLSKRKKKIYYETNQKFARFTHLDHDLVVVHDPQPLPLIEFYKKKQPWIFRCHVDLSNPDPQVWRYLKGFIRKYDSMVVSKQSYERKDLDIPQFVVHPAIDPLSLKNEPLKQKTIDRYLDKFGISRDKPIISQISRFDKWKDPIGVLRIFARVRKKVDCQLVLLGSLAPDDPEGQLVFEKVQRIASRMKYKRDIKLLLVKHDILVNSLQRASHVVIQKSRREGFGLVVSEALYKGTPVVASNVGGIPLQVIDGVTGFLHDPNDTGGFARSVLELIKNPELGKRLGRNGKEHVKRNFLITRLMLDWILLFQHYLL